MDRIETDEGDSKYDNGDVLEGMDMDEVDTEIDVDREVVPLSKEGEPSMVNLKTVTMGVMDTVPHGDGLLLGDQGTRHVLSEDLVISGVIEHDATSLTTSVANTYNRRNSKSMKVSDLGTKKVLVLWVDGAKKGEIESDVI